MAQCVVATLLLLSRLLLSDLSDFVYLGDGCGVRGFPALGLSLGPLILGVSCAPQHLLPMHLCHVQVRSVEVIPGHLLQIVVELGVFFEGRATLSGRLTSRLLGPGRLIDGSIYQLLLVLFASLSDELRFDGLLILLLRDQLLIVVVLLFTDCIDSLEVVHVLDRAWAATGKVVPGRAAGRLRNRIFLQGVERSCLLLR